MKDIDWYRVRSAAFTRIRVDFTVATLERLAATGNETPVNGDELADMKRSRRRFIRTPVKPIWQYLEVGV